MKTNQNRITLLMSLRICLCVTLLAFTSCKSCKKELTTEDLIAQLPAATQTGANTFGCLIDGVPYVPNGATSCLSGTCPPITGGYLSNNSSNGSRNSVEVVTKSMSGLGFAIYLAGVNTPDVYPLRYNSNNGYALAYVPQKNDTPILTVFTYGSTSGQVNVTKADTVNKIVAGTFEFEATHIQTGKTIKITNGRFDLKNQ
jgi:hypothetical protein